MVCVCESDLDEQALISANGIIANWICTVFVTTQIQKKLHTIRKVKLIFAWEFNLTIQNSSVHSTFFKQYISRDSYKQY